MRYIRTKDGIYEIDETMILTSMPPCYKVIKPTDKYYAINKKSVIKQANTIEELCDKFIIHSRMENWIRTSWGSTKEAISIYKKVLEGFIQEVYGAIWTDKGLIYVAKMNDKGELELL